MTFGELVTKTTGFLFPAGEAENLVTIHRGFVENALYDLQVAVPCLRFGNLDLQPHCASFFNCGMTVIPAPRGRILKIFVIDKLDPDTGLEDANADDNWCNKVNYQQVDYCNMEGYIRLCQRSSSSTIQTVSDALAGLFFGVYRRKTSYPAPDDAGMVGLPRLPEGYHYPQASTDADGRSPSGIWAIEGGRIHIAPWIQSTETLCIRWNGIKRRWADTDLVEDDPKFEEAVRLSVGHRHEAMYGDPAKAKDYYTILHGTPPTTGTVGVMMELIHECHEETRLRSCNEALTGEHAARGLGLSTGGVSGGGSLFYNTRVEYTATCPTGQSGTAVTVVKEAGTVSSALSVADATARASQQAADEATAQIVCEDAEVIFYNTEQSYTSQCVGEEGAPTPTGSSVTKTVAAGKYSSTTSQEAADAAALAAATAAANSNLTCVFYNREVTETATCPVDTVGDDQEATVSAGVYTGNTQAEADEKATAAAQNTAAAALNCGANTYVIGNLIQIVPMTIPCNLPSGCGVRNWTGNAVCPANFYTRVTTASRQSQDLLELNATARDYAQFINGPQQASAYCNVFLAQCLSHPQTG